MSDCTCTPPQRPSVVGACACPVHGMEALRGTVALLDTVLKEQLLQHPLPWHVESDWTEEVRAASGYCIAKCRTTEDAEAIIRRAEEMAERIAAQNQKRH